MSKRRVDRPSRAAAAAETRAALLEAGAALLREQPVGTLFNQITAATVAGRAGRTTGAFYHHWEDQESYQRELVRYALDSSRIDSTPTAAQDVHDALEAGLPLAELVRHAAGHNFEIVRANPYVPLHFALWAKQSLDDDLRNLLREDYCVTMEALVPVYAALFERLQVAPRPPFTINTFAVVLNALVEGLTLRQGVDPEMVPLDIPSTDVGGQPWDLFSVAVMALVPSMTMPLHARDSSSPLDSNDDVRIVSSRIVESWSQ